MVNHYTKLNRTFLIDKRREQKARNREFKTKAYKEKLRERRRTNLWLPAEHCLLYNWSPQTEIEVDIIRLRVCCPLPVMYYLSSYLSHAMSHNYLLFPKEHNVCHVSLHVGQFPHLAPHITRIKAPGLSTCASLNIFFKPFCICLSLRDWTPL